MYGIEIARNVKSDDGRPVFYVDGVHHAREWPAGEYPMIFAHYLVEGLNTNPEVTRLLTQGRVIIVPVVNVDGFDYSRSSPLGAQTTVDSAHGDVCGILHCEAYWRKNRRSYTEQTVPVIQRNPDAYGVDPNRNYSYHWGGGGSTDSTLLLGDQTYRGPGPQSEPETKNVEDLILSRSVTSIITNHTYSRLVLRPWGDTDKDAPGEQYLEALGARMAKAMGGYKNIKGIELYVTTGSMADWGYGTLGIPSYTFEHGLAFHPPYTGCSADCVGTEWKGVMKAYMVAANAALDEQAHGIIAGKVVDSSGKPLKATLTITKRIDNPLSPGNPTGDRAYKATLRVSIDVDGSFEWHMPPSTAPYLLEDGKN
ncbi:MAG: M14 family zinc carboxypeptidase, partial [Acidimicrobiia bacterium]